MKVNLLINFYRDKHPLRQKELEACLLKNIDNDSIDRIIIVISKNDIEYLKNIVGTTRKIFTITKEDRPSYNYYFDVTSAYEEDINVIANTDIVLDRRSLERLKMYKWGNNCLALSRWDYVRNSMNDNEAVHYNHRDSQDTWILKGSFRSIKEAYFPLGKKGCDNRIAYLLSKYYNVINPSLDIKTYHYHLTNIRNYAPHGVNEDLIHPPYKLINPTRL